MNESLLVGLGVAVALGLIWMFRNHRKSPAGHGAYIIKNAKVCPSCSARQDAKAKRCGVCGGWF